MTTRLKEQEGGFTITEVLVTISIILIIIAISVPLLLNQKNKLTESDLETYLINSATTLEGERNSSGGYYPNEIPDKIKGRVITGDIEIEYSVDQGRKSYCLEGSVKAGSFVKHVTNETPEPVEGQCS